MNPPRWDGRRCLSADELEALGFIKDEHGRWRDEEQVQKVRETFAGPPRTFSQV